MLTARDLMDNRGTKFTIGAIYPPEKQKAMEEKLDEAMRARGMEPQGALLPEVKVMTLDEALDYFTRLKEIQDRIEADERGESPTKS